VLLVIVGVEHSPLRFKHLLGIFNFRVFQEMCLKETPVNKQPNPYIPLVWPRIRETAERHAGPWRPRDDQAQILYKLLQEFLFASHDKWTNVTSTTASRMGVEKIRGRKRDRSNSERGE